MTSWVPSHVELTVHQARDLLLKTKNSSSVVYVSVVAEREKFCSPLLTRSTAPLWQYSTKIPLMSLDTTLHCTVRQKTIIKDKFLGLISLPLGSFSISSKPVTHWYKLGPKPGRTSSKLRGDLLLTVTFLSNWVAEEPDSLDFVFASNGHCDILKGSKPAKSSPQAFRRKSMLKRTKSEQKVRSNEMGADSVTSESKAEGGGGSESTKAVKKEKSGLFRLSLRKKTRSPVLETCDDEFTLASLSLPGTSLVSSSSLQRARNSPQSGDDGINDLKFSASESLSRTLDPKYLPNGCAKKPSSIASGGEGEGEGEEEEEEEKEKEKGEGKGKGRDKGGEGEEGEARRILKGDKQTQTGDKMSPALRYHNFRRRKRPWSMHTIPPIPLSPNEESTPTASTLPLGEESPQLRRNKQKGSEERKSEVVTFRAKSNSLVRSSNGRRGRMRSNSIDVAGRNRQMQVEVDEDSESYSGSSPSTPTRSPLLGTTRGLRSSDRSNDRNKRSGMGNIAHSATLPIHLRHRSQSVSEPRTRTGRTGEGNAVSGRKRGDSVSKQLSLPSKSPSPLGPRVPLGTSLTDSPVLRSSRDSAGSRSSRDSSGSRGAHMVVGGGELSPKTSTPRAHPPRNPSPIQLDATLMEEDEEEAEAGAEAGEGKSGKENKVSGSTAKREASQVVKSRVPIETESAAFQVDARELQITLEACPGLSVKRNIVVSRQPVKQNSSSAPSSPNISLSRKVPPNRPSTEEAGNKSLPDDNTAAQPSSGRKLPELPQSLSPFSRGNSSNSRAHSTSPIVGSHGRDSTDGLSDHSASTLALSGGLGNGREGGSGLVSSMSLPRRNRHRVSFKENSAQDYEAIPALPPSLTNSQTPPRRAELIRSFSEMDRSLSSLADPKSTSTPRKDRGLHNVRTFDPRLFNLPPSPQKYQPKPSITKPSTNTPTSPPKPSDPPPGHSVSPPGHSVSPPGHSVSPPANSSVSPPGHSVSPPANSVSPPGHSVSPPGRPSSQTRSVTPDMPRSRPTTPQKLVQSYPGMPLSQERGKRGGVRGGSSVGGLQGAISRYQESKRKGKTSRRSLDETGKAQSMQSCSIYDPLPQLSVDLGALESRLCVSAGNSPQLQRRATTHLGHPSRTQERGWKNPFSNLRRTQSHHQHSPGHSLHTTEVDVSGSQGSTQSIASLGRSSTSSSSRLDMVPPPLIEEVDGRESGTAAQVATTSTAVPSGRLYVCSVATQRHTGLEVASKNSNSNNERDSQQTLATPTSLTSDTDSVKTFGSERTLVEASGSVSGGGASTTTAALPALRRDMLNLLPTGHKHTCSSLDSEGLGSLASEEIVMEETVPQDWTQWAKEDLIRELVYTRNKLHSTEEELKAVRGYVDNLLLRIMETNPAILSIGNL